MKNPKIKVFGFFPYDRSGKVTWTLNELGLAYEFVALDYEKNEHRTSEHLAKHPMGAVPVLQIDDLVIHESDAICWFLAESFPRANLLPDVGTPARAICLQWFQFCSGTLGYANSSRWPLKNLPEYPEDAKALDGKPAKEFLVLMKKEIEGEFQKSLQTLEDRLSRQDYLLERFSVADISTAYSLGWMGVKGDLEKYPSLQAYVARNKARPAAIQSKAFQNR